MTTLLSRIQTLIKPGAVRYKPTENDVQNPERGWYVGYNLVKARDASAIRAAGRTLVGCMTLLPHTPTLPPAFLTQLASGFTRLREAGLKCVLRFRYDADGTTGDVPKAIMLGHIQQLAATMRAHADVTALVQSGMIGAWGEMHSSTNGLDNDADRSAILHEQLLAWPGAICVRTPGMKRAYLTKYGAAYRDRIGLFNDCYLASASDKGTYKDEADHAYFDTENTVVGGETCALFPPRTDGDNALVELAKDRVSYLNAEYNQAVLGVWVATGHYPEVSRRLGYRLVLKTATFPRTARVGQRVTVKVNLVNEGFAAPFNPRPTFLVVGEEPLAVGSVAGWKPGSALSLSHDFEFAKTGTHRLALWMPDSNPRLRTDPRYAVRCANIGTWDATQGMNVLGEVVAK